MALELYDFPLSGNSYRVRLFLSLLELPFTVNTVNLATGENREAQFLQINPLGQVPVLIDDEHKVFDSHAILLYLASKYGKNDWLPDNPADQARVMQWVFLDANELHNGIGYARNEVTFGVPTGNLEHAQARGQNALSAIDLKLSNGEWLELGRPTLADVACYPLIALASEAGISTSGFPHVAKWLDKVRQLPNFIPEPRYQ